MDKILFSINNIQKYNSSKRKRKEKQDDNRGGVFKRRQKKVRIDNKHKKETRRSRNTPFLEILYY